MGVSAGFVAHFENLTGNPVTYLWDLGDGFTSAEASPSHTYQQIGAYTVSVTVTDQSGRSGEASMVLNVTQGDDLVDLECAAPVQGEGWCNDTNSLAETINPTAINGISFADAQRGWLVGENGAIAYSSDSGIHWTKQFDAGTGIKGVSAIDSTHVWAVDRSNIRISSDGGLSWSTVPTGTRLNLTGVKFVDQQHGWIIGTGQQILGTADGGQTWVEQTSNISNGVLQRIDAIDATHAWAVGDMGFILRTTDGQTWNPIKPDASNRNIAGVSFVDLLNGFVVGANGLVLKTTDGGQNWEPMTFPLSTNLTVVKFITPLYGWVVTSNAAIYQTTDGGSNWTLQATPPQTNGLPVIEAANVDNAWVATGVGTYLVTTTGGK